MNDLGYVFGCLCLKLYSMVSLYNMLSLYSMVSLYNMVPLYSMSSSEAATQVQTCHATPRPYHKD